MQWPTTHGPSPLWYACTGLDAYPLQAYDATDIDMDQHPGYGRHGGVASLTGAGHGASAEGGGDDDLGLGLGLGLGVEDDVIAPPGLPYIGLGLSARSGSPGGLSSDSGGSGPGVAGDWGRRGRKRAHVRPCRAVDVGVGQLPVHVLAPVIQRRVAVALQARKALGRLCVQSILNFTSGRSSRNVVMRLCDAVGSPSARPRLPCQAKWCPHTTRFF